MSDEIVFHGPSHEVGADASAPASPPATDPLRDVRALRRWVRIGVYAAIFATEPLYIFVLKMSLQQVLVGLVIGLIIAFTAIEGAFNQMFKLRKRSAYPNELLVELGGVSNLGEAAQQALSVTGRLLGVRASFLALREAGGALKLAAVSGIDAESAERLLVSGAAEANEAMRLLQPVTVHPAIEEDAVPQPPAKASRGEQLVFVPVLALQQPIGVLALANGRKNKDLKDSQLLLGVGVALGLSLESLRQKEELRRGEERLRTVITGAPVILFATDRDGVFTLAEGKGLDALQIVPNDVVGRSAFEVYSRRPEILADFRRALAGEETTSVHKMAGVFLESRLSPKRGPDGEVAGVIGIGWDITERMRAQEALEESEERLRTVVTNVPVVLFAIDREGIFTLSEGRGLDALGLRPGQVVGHSVFDVYRDFPDISENIRRALAGESFTAIVDAGGLVWETNYTPVRDATGEVSGIIGVAANITERKRAEEAVRESESLYRSLVETCPDAVILVGADGTILKVNRPASTLFGFEHPEAVVGMPARDFISEEDIERVREDVGRTMITGVLSNIEYTLVKRDGTRVPVELSLSPITAACGETKAYIGVARDITERKRADALLAGEKRVLEMIATGAPLTGVLEVLTGIVEEQSEGMFCSVLLMDQSGTKLRHGAAPSLPEEYSHAVDGIEIGPVAGSCGTAAHRKELVVVSDVASDPLWADFKELALAAGLRACWSLPIISTRGDVLGTFAMYYSEPRAPEQADIELIERAAHIAGIAIERKRAEVALRESEEKYRELVENTNEVIYTLDATGIITYVSPIVEQVGGYTPSDIIGRSFTELIHPDDLMPLIESFQRTISGHLEPSEYRLKTNDGEYRWVRSSSRPIYDGELAVGLRGLLVDITERKKAEEALRESEERFRMMADTAPVMVWMSDQGGGCTFFNKPGLDFTGLTLEEALGDGWLKAIHPDDLQRCMDAVGAAVQTQETVSLEYRMRRADGEYRWIMDLGVPRFEAGGACAGYIGSAIDITERKLAEETVKHLAHHDALTGLPNRTLFEDRLRLALAQAQRSGEMLAVMFLDLDHFKVVNDTLGHGGGDDLLQNVAGQLSRIVREGDTVARVGGDEFTLLLPGITQPDDAVEVAERILEALKHPQHLGGHEFRVTTSIGITIYPQDGTDSESLLRNADTAMYRAKERGRDNYQLYTPAMNASVLARLALENDLRHAMERGEFLVHYQPIVEVASGKISGAEALVRWQHPDRGLVQPDEFIAFAEESGLILPLGEWVLRNACLQNRAWQDAGYASMRVTVNLSARQLQQENLVATVAQILEESGLAPEHLQLEITEGAVMKNVDFIITMLQQLRLMGVGISVDDFGTGYSSLSYLKRFPIDSVKIDRSFVRDLATDPNDAVIVTTVIAMARSLNLKVIAEGVESEEQLDFLRQQDCDEFQGYLFSRPVAPHSLEKLLSPTNGAKRKVARLKLA